MDEATRQKLSELQKKRLKKRREQGLKRYWRKRRKEIAERKLAEEKEREKEKKRKLAEREKEKNKKKPGRKKKRGPKINKYKRRKAKLAKLKKQNTIVQKPPITFKIMLCRNGKRISTIGQYRTSEDAYAAFKRQKEISDSVVFPRSLRVYIGIENSIDECVMIHKTNEGPTMLRNEYGKLVEHTTNLEGWQIVDKFKYNVEETFWVWGYDNRKDRKTFTWIYEELVIGDGFDPYEFRRIFTYRNNLLIRFDDGSLSIVICKSDYDSARLYNMLQETARTDKIKQLVFIGDKTEKSELTEKLENEIIEITGWTLKRLRMKGTTYQTKK